MRAIASWNAPTIFAPAGDNFAAAEDGACLADRARGSVAAFFLTDFFFILRIVSPGGRKESISVHRGVGRQSPEGTAFHRRRDSLGWHAHVRVGLGIPVAIHAHADVGIPPER
jgi:hypothetical protein